MGTLSAAHAHALCACASFLNSVVPLPRHVSHTLAATVPCYVRCALQSAPLLLLVIVFRVVFRVVVIAVLFPLSLAILARALLVE
jgi:hypothetical protein